MSPPSTENKRRTPSLPHPTKKRRKPPFSLRPLVSRDRLVSPSDRESSLEAFVWSPFPADPPSSPPAIPTVQGSRYLRSLLGASLLISDRD